LFPEGKRRAEVRATDMDGSFLALLTDQELRAIVILAQ
jgi:hypothetical protein